MSTHLTHSSTDTTLVVGATGKTGRRVAQRLQDRGFATRLASRGADHAFDWDDRCTWEPAVAGTSAAYISYFPDLAVPGAAETVADFARVAVAGGVRRIVLLGEVYELTGPRALRFDEAIAEIARASGRDVRFEAVPLEPFAASMRSQEVPKDVIWLLGYLFGEILDGRNVEVCDGVRRALGREPRDFAEYARRAAATGVWGAGS